MPTETAAQLYINIGPYLKLVLAFIVGCIGSAAYITALYFKFIGDTERNRKIVMGPFMKYVKDKEREGIWHSKMSILKSAWYCSMGGFVAVIFQFDVPNFVSVQSLILGATWPAIVSQFLSGRMTTPSQNEIDELRRPFSSLKEGQSWTDRIQRLAELNKKTKP
jgi:hypothetical protein